MPNGPPERRVPRVDYDAVAPGYDRRYRDGGPADLAAFVRARCADARDRPVLEVGCGTGRWLAEAGATGARAVGLDPSAAMLARAREQAPAAALVRGRAESLPFCGRELRRRALHLRRPSPRRSRARRRRGRARAGAAGGTLSVLALAPHDGLDRWYVYDYFEGDAGDRPRALSDDGRHRRVDDVGRPGRRDASRSRHASPGRRWARPSSTIPS